MHGSNESGGIRPDGRVHYEHSIERGDPEWADYHGEGTFSLAARALAWVRAMPGWLQGLRDPYDIARERRRRAS